MISRRWMMGLLPWLAVAQETEQDKKNRLEYRRRPGDRKFYVTGGDRLQRGQNDCNVSPLICWGKDSLDAITRSGITVWEAKHYEDAHFEESEGWLRSCAELQRQKE